MFQRFVAGCRSGVFLFQHRVVAAFVAASAGIVANRIINKKANRFEGFQFCTPPQRTTGAKIVQGVRCDDRGRGGGNREKEREDVNAERRALFVLVTLIKCFDCENQARLVPSSLKPWVRFSCRCCERCSANKHGN